MTVSSRKINRQGFSLFGVIVALAVASILAATLVPAAFRQLMRQRESETKQELLLIEAGLVDFFEDVGRFPNEAEGLAALISDPGVTGWSGPYVAFGHEDPIDQIENDAWNLSYQYDTYPTTDPADAAEVLVVSGGLNRLVDAGSVGGTWTMISTDDLMGAVTPDRANREKIVASTAEQENLASAVQSYFHDNQVYPANLNQLSAQYLDDGVGSDALYDQWNRSYLLTPANFSVPQECAITSRGPDGAVGGGDDVVLNLNSVIPGRKHSYYELAITQAAVDAQAGVSLTGDWTADRSLFSLASVLENDGWGNPYEEQMSTRIILSAGPDADYWTPDDNIPPGVVPDDTAADGTGVEYVDGTGDTTGPQCDAISFEVTNPNDDPIVITTITVSWSAPTAYFQKVRFNGVLIFNRANPRTGSGELVTLSTPVTLNAGETATFELDGFRSKASGGGSKPDMSGVTFTVEFSDGSVITFESGSC